MSFLKTNGKNMGMDTNYSKENQMDPENPDQNLKMFAVFFSGQLISILGSEIVQFAVVVWLALETESVIIMSLSMFLAYIPAIILGPIAGVLVDKWDKKKIIVISDSLQAIVTIFLIASFSVGIANIWFVLGLNFFRGVFQAFHGPTFMTIVPLMVPKDKLSRVNGLNQLSTSVIRMIGPILGAFVLSVWDFRDILWVDVITFLIAVIFVLKIKIPKTKAVENSREKKSESSFMAQFKEGLRIIGSVKGLTIIIILAMFVNFLLMPLNTQLPSYIIFEAYHGGTDLDLALVLSAMQGAIVAGAFLASVKSKWKNKVRIFITGIIFVFIGTIIIAIAPYQQFWVMAIGSVVGFFGVPILNAMLMTIIQLAIPPEKMGRVSSILMVLSSIASPVGILISGPLALLIGISNLFLYSGIIGIVAVSLTYIFSPLRKMDDSAFGVIHSEE
jgi:DHA3 family macrolide efflux protein-like MFS transporter